MFDSITSEEEGATQFGFHLSSVIATAPSITNSAINSIASQQNSFGATSTYADYESIGSYEDETRETLTLATTLDSGEYDSLDDWRESLPSSTCALKPVSVILASKEVPSDIAQLRCKYDQKERKKEKEKERKKEMKNKDMKSGDTNAVPIKTLKDLVPLEKKPPTMSNAFKSALEQQMNATQQQELPKMSSIPLAAPKETRESLSFKLPPMVPLQKKPDTATLPFQLPVLVPLQKKQGPTSFASPIEPPRLSSMQLPPLVPLQKKKESLSFASPVTATQSLPFKMPLLVPLQRKAVDFGNSFPTTLQTRNLPPLVPLATNRSLNSMKEGVSSAFFGASSASPFGAQLGAANRFDIGCSMHGTDGCPRTYVRDNRSDLYDLWLTYNAAPVVTDSDPVAVLIPTKTDLAAAVKQLDGDKNGMREYLKSHIIREDPPNMRVKLNYKGNDVFFTVDNREPVKLGATTNKRVWLIPSGADFWPLAPSMNDDSMTMDSKLGDLKRKVIGLTKKPLPRRYADLAFVTDVDPDTILESQNEMKGDERAMISVKIRTTRAIDTASNTITVDPEKMLTVYDGDTPVIRRGDPASVSNDTEGRRFLIDMKASGVTLSSLCNGSGIVVSIREKSSGRRQFMPSELTMKAATKPLLFGVPMGSIEDMMTENSLGTTEFVTLRSVKDANRQDGQLGVYEFVFRRNGTCQGRKFDPRNTDCGYKLVHIVVIFKRNELVRSVDYAASFAMHGFGADAPIVESDSFDGIGDKAKKYVGKTKKKVKTATTPKKKNKKSSSSCGGKKEKMPPTYAALVYNEKYPVREWRWPKVDVWDVDTQENTNTDRANIALRLYDRVDRVLLRLEKRADCDVLNGPIAIHEADGPTRGTKALFIPLILKGIKLEAVMEKGHSIHLTQQMNTTQALPGVLNGRQLYFAFSDRDLATIKQLIATPSKDDNETLVFKANGPEMSNGRGTFYFVFTRMGCSAKTRRESSECNYTLAYIKMIFDDYELEMKSVMPLGDTFHECLYSEIVNPSALLGTALSQIEQTNKFGDFVSMNGTHRLVGEIARQIKAEMSEAGPSSFATPIQQEQQQIPLATPVEYTAEQLHDVLYDMNTSHLPLRKNEISERATTVINALKEKVGYATLIDDNAAKWRVLSNLNRAIGVIDSSIYNIRVRDGENV